MNKNQLFSLSIVLIIAVSFVSSVYIAYRPGTTQIITGAVLTEPNLAEQTYSMNNKPTSSSNKNSASSSKTASNSSRSKITAGDSGSLSELSGSEIIFSDIGADYDPDHYESDGDLSKIPDGETSSESSEESGDLSSSNPVEPSDKPDFTAVREKIKNLSDRFEVGIKMNLSDQSADKVNAFVTSDSAMGEMINLESVLEGIDDELLSVLTSKYNIGIRLSYPGAGADSSVDLIRDEEELLIMVSCGNTRWSYSFCLELFRIIESIMEQATDMQSLFFLFSTFNPRGFYYGEFNFDYIKNDDITKTYFLYIDQQLSAVNDYEGLYTAYMAGDYPNMYFTEQCPMYQKLCFIQDNINEYVIG